MPSIKNVGSYSLDGRSLSCDFYLDADKFFEMFASEASLLSGGAKSEITEAIRSSGSIKIGRKSPDEITNFFNKCASKTDSMSQSDEADSSKSMGFSTDEREEHYESEDLKKQGSDSTELHYETDSETGKIYTYDKDSGEIEGEIILGKQGNTGLLVPLEIKEIINAEYEHNAEEPKDESREVIGSFKISNPSEIDKLWDIDISFERNQEVKWNGVKYSEDEDAELEEMDVEEPIHITTMDPGATQIYEYSIEEFQNPSLKIHEFISTQNDEEIESYSLLPEGENTILFKLTATNISDYPIRNVRIVKAVEPSFLNVNIIDGEASIESDGIVWDIEQLDAGAEVVLKINMDIDTSDQDIKARTGRITAEYEADDALTGTNVNKFDAYTTNFVGIEDIQKEDDPDAYLCSVIFHNKSDFQIHLVNLDVYEELNPEEKLLDIDPNEIPELAAGATWKSVEWETKTEDGFEPLFHKYVEFFVVSQRKNLTVGSISIDDLELAVAMLKSFVYYSVSELPSFRETKFNSLLELRNDGMAELNEVLMVETIQAGYIPPNPEEIELFVVRPEIDDDEEDFEEEDEDEEEEDFEGEEDGEEVKIDEESEIDWDYLGDQVHIDPSRITIEPADQDPEVEHVLKIHLEDLVNDAIGLFLPEMILRVKYPITAMKPAKETEYVSNCYFETNTLPAGSPIESKPDEVKIPVVHIRSRTIKGKAIRGLPSENDYEITLTIKNRGDADLTNVQIRDVVDKNSFEYSNFSLEPTEYDELEGKDLLIWVIDQIEANGEYEITYTITGKEDYRVSDNQFSV